MQDLKNATAVILAGGLGTRLRATVGKKSKVLADLDGRPFLAHVLDRLVEVEMVNVILCVSYQAQSVQEAFGDCYRSLRLRYSFEEVPKGTAKGLALARPLMKSDHVLVMNGDTLCKVNLQAFWSWHHEVGAAISLVACKKSGGKKGGVLSVDQSGVVTSFCEKDQMSNDLLVSAGTYLFDIGAIDAIAESGSQSLEEEVFPQKVGHGLFAYQTSEVFLDIGTPETYAEAQRLVRNPGY